MIAPTNPVTPDHLLRMPEAEHFELVGGKLKERTVGFKSARVGAKLLRLLSVYVESKALGWVLNPDASFQCYPDDPNKVRRPDISFLSFATLPRDQEPTGHCRVPPELAVEIISPHDVFEEVIQKAVEYLNAGVRIVWVVDPATQIVQIFRPGGGEILTNRDMLTGEDIIPGFSCRVSEIFAIGDSPVAASK